jgi:hypothetical protein
MACRAALLRTRGWLHFAVRAREYQPLVAVIEPDEIGRLTIWSPHLHHVADAIGPVDGAAMHAQPVTNARSHVDHLAARVGCR